jgi:Zn-dependent protease
VIDPLAPRLATRAPAARSAGGLFPTAAAPTARWHVRELTLFGVPLTIDLSWLFGLGLATWTFADSVLPHEAPGHRTSTYVAAGALAALLLLGSVALHEAGHWLAARRAGLPVVGLTLSFVGGALALGAAPRSPAVEARIALGGPLASLATAVTAALAHVAMVESDVDPVLATIPALVAVGNLAIALVNLLPGLPLDGGRMLRAALWGVTGDPATATRIAHGLGRALAVALLTLALVASASGDAAAALWASMLALAIWLHP